MAAIFRAIGFFASAIGVEFLHGTGFVAFAASLLVGWRRWPGLLLAVLVAGGAAVSLLSPESDAAAGKVSHGLSNIAFVALVYGVIVLGGYAAGRVLRRLQS